MEITFLVKSFFGLVALLGILVFYLLYSPKRKEKKLQAKKVQSSRAKVPSLQELLKIIKDKKSSATELQEATEMVLKYYGTIPPKHGVRADKGFNIYAEIILLICRHPNTNKKIILSFDKGLSSKNEAYKKEINDFLTKGLNSRGF